MKLSGVVTPKDKTRKSNPLAVLLIGELSKLQKVSKLQLTGVIVESGVITPKDKTRKSNPLAALSHRRVIKTAKSEQT